MSALPASEEHQATPSNQMAAIEVFADVLLRGELGGVEDQEDDFYSRLCEATTQVARMRRAVIFRYDSARRRVRAAGSHGVDPAIFADDLITVESAPIARRALEEDRVIVARDSLEGELPARYLDLLEPATLVCTPMAAGGRWIGVLLAERGADEPPVDEAECELLFVLGKTAALVSLARVATRQHEKARQLEQRIDLAREVHDGVIQRLFGVSLALSSEHVLDEDTRRRCAEEIQAALADLRSALQRPLGRSAADTRTTLAAEVRRLAHAHADLGIEAEGDSDLSVPTGLEPLAQSVLGEAVRNAHKHASPTRVGVRTSTRDGNFVMEVTNDGVHGRARHTGMGLRLVAFEVLQAGGLLEFGERPEHRWQVRLVVPCPATGTQ